MRRSGRAEFHAAVASARSGASTIQQPTGFPVVGCKDQVSSNTGLAGACFDFPVAMADGIDSVAACSGLFIAALSAKVPFDGTQQTTTGAFMS
jgi:hypothetical protein